MEKLSESATQALRREVFASGDGATYMLIDGASVPTLMDRLYDDQPTFSCLLTGPLEPDMQEVAPYLVELRDGEPFADWVLDNGFGQHWGIVLRSRLEHDQARRRFRKLLFARSDEGDSLFFRFYDPRVFREFIPRCTEPDLWPWFDDIDCYLVEAAGPDQRLLRISAHGDERVIVEDIPLATAGGREQPGATG